MFRLYSDRAAERIIRRLSARIGALSRRYEVPSAVIKAVLYRELTMIDLFDLFADLLVRCNWARVRLLSRLTGRPIAVSEPRKGFFRKLDSSTGYAQIFARTAIRAANDAIRRGRCTPEELAPPDSFREDRAEDLYAVWRRLNRETEYNLQLAVLNLLSAAEEKTGRADFASFSPEELKRVFTRYNGTSPEITAYGEDTWRFYLRFMDEEWGR